jgi:peptide/nickel transport system substrate-binding protein
MQQVMYAENPQDVLTYFDYLQAVNTDKWQGWTPYYNEGGPVFYNGMIQSYLNVGPKAAVGGGASSGGADTGAFVAVVVAVLAVGAVAWLLVARRRRAERAEED